jgi:hypothetical protein
MKNARLLLTTAIVFAPAAATAADIKPFFAITVGKGNYTQIDEFGAAVEARMIARTRTEVIKNSFTETTAHPLAPTLTAGAEFGRYFGAEVSYINLGHSDWYTLGDVLLPNGRGGFEPYPYRFYTQRTTLLTKGYSAAVLGRWPLGEHWRVQGRIGAFRSKTHAEGALCHQVSTSALRSEYGFEDWCSPILVTNPATGAPIGGFNPGTAGNLHFAAHSTMPMAGVAVEWVNSEAVGFGLEYNLYRSRTPVVAGEDPTPLEGVRSTASVHFLSLRLSFRPWEW